MRPNNLRTIWNKGGAVVNGWLGIPNSFSAEVMATLGWDSLVIDLQHGLIDYQSSVLMMQAISTTSVTPLVRVPWNDPAIIMKCLDAGAYGVICPMINDRKEAERFVGACRYPPRGYRSAGPIRGLIYGGSDYQSKSDETIVALAMIETADGVKHLDEICSTPGTRRTLHRAQRPLAFPRRQGRPGSDRREDRSPHRSHPGREQAPQDQGRHPHGKRGLCQGDDREGLRSRDGVERQPHPCSIRQGGGGRDARRRRQGGTGRRLLRPWRRVRCGGPAQSRSGFHEHRIR